MHTPLGLGQAAVDLGKNCRWSKVVGREQPMAGEVVELCYLSFRQRLMLQQTASSGFRKEDPIT